MAGQQSGRDGALVLAPNAINTVLPGCRSGLTLPRFRFWWQSHRGMREEDYLTFAERVRLQILCDRRTVSPRDILAAANAQGFDYIVLSKTPSPLVPVAAARPFERVFQNDGYVIYGR